MKRVHAMPVGTCAMLVAGLVSSPASTGKSTIAMLLLLKGDYEKEVGTVSVDDSAHGVQFTSSLTGLTPGVHDFHVHENPDCRPAEKDGKMVPGHARGGDDYPEGSEKSLGPCRDGALGELPVLTVDAKGNATIPVLAPRVRVAGFVAHS